MVKGINGDDKNGMRMKKMLKVIAQPAALPLMPTSLFSISPDGKTIEHQDVNRDGNVDHTLVRDKSGHVICKSDLKYDENGNLIERSEDTNGDGVPDRVYKYDENGNLIEKSEDTNGDGVPDRVYKYDENGNLIEESEDANGDGKLDQVNKFGI